MVTTAIRTPQPSTVQARSAVATHLRDVEDESVHVLREVADAVERPVLLFSGGKDSVVPLRLAEKAFPVTGATAGAAMVLGG